MSRIGTQTSPDEINLDFYPAYRDSVIDGIVKLDGIMGNANLSAPEKRQAIHDHFFQ